eukprot:Gb_15435 [translate_table: standard]
MTGEVAPRKAATVDNNSEEHWNLMVKLSNRSYLLISQKKFKPSQHNSAKTKRGVPVLLFQTKSPTILPERTQQAKRNGEDCYGDTCCNLTELLAHCRHMLGQRGSIYQPSLFVTRMLNYCNLRSKKLSWILARVRQNESGGEFAF